MTAERIALAARTCARVSALLGMYSLGGMAVQQKPALWVLTVVVVALATGLEAWVRERETWVRTKN